MPLRGKQPHERVCLQTGGARCAPPSARPAALPLLQLCLLCAGAGFICPGHVSFDADFSFCSVGRGLDPSAELPKNACRGEHCSPVPVCLVRGFPTKALQRQVGGRTMSAPTFSIGQSQCFSTHGSKTVGAHSICARPVCGCRKLPRADMESAPTDKLGNISKQRKVPPWSTLN